MTLLEKENKLNEELSKEPASVTYARFMCLTDKKQRRNYCSPLVLSNRVNNGTLGGLIRRLDKPYFEELTKDYI